MAAQTNLEAGFGCDVRDAEMRDRPADLSTRACSYAGALCGYEWPAFCTNLLRGDNSENGRMGSGVRERGGRSDWVAKLDRSLDAQSRKDRLGLAEYGCPCRILDVRLRFVQVLCVAATEW